MINNINTIIRTYIIQMTIENKKKNNDTFFHVVNNVSLSKKNTDDPFSKPGWVHIYNKNGNIEYSFSEQNIKNKNKTKNERVYNMNDAILCIEANRKKYKTFYNQLNGIDAYENMYCMYDSYSDFIENASDSDVETN